jgi:3',5'-cyclic AMP phosphodiesterase CpdA
MLIAQISDMHLGAPGSWNDTLVHTDVFLERAVEHLNALTPRPDVVIATGDLVESGGVEQYERLRAILAPLAMPIYLVPGNHDDRTNLVRVFADHAYLPRDGGFLHYTVEDWPVRLVVLDTLVPGEDRGHLCTKRLAWLDARLAEAPERPTMVVMHHPPFVTGLAAMDSMGFDTVDALAGVIRRHPQVERIVSGHLHRTIMRRFAGTVACTCPGTAHQLSLDLVPAKRLAVVMEPPACLLHLWLGESQGLVTHVSLIGRDHPALTVFDGSTWVKDIVPPPGFHSRPGSA